MPHEQRTISALLNLSFLGVKEVRQILGFASTDGTTQTPPNELFTNPAFFFQPLA
ncbi:MAG: hypothetical protein ACJ746_14855 [Bryobacteraceae bacterium]